MVGWLAGHVTRKKTATNLQRFDFPEWKKEYPSGNRLNDIHLEQVIKVIFDVRPHRRHRRLNRIRQMAPTCPHGRAHWRHLANMIQLVLPSAPEFTTQTANRSVQPFLHSSRQKVNILYNGRPFPQKLPLPTGIWTPSNTRFLYRLIRAHKRNGISIRPAVFVQMTAECPYTLQ